MSDSATIYSFRKNALEEVRLRFRKFRGRQYFDIRVFVEIPSGHAEFTATQRAICLDAYTFPEFKKGMLALEEELIRQGLLEAEKR